jgi:hypothetical protein
VGWEQDPFWVAVALGGEAGHEAKSDLGLSCVISGKSRTILKPSFISSKWERISAS